MHSRLGVHRYNDLPGHNSVLDVFYLLFEKRNFSQLQGDDRYLQKS